MHPIRQPLTFFDVHQKLSYKSRYWGHSLRDQRQLQRRRVRLLLRLPYRSEQGCVYARPCDPDSLADTDVEMDEAYDGHALGRIQGLFQEDRHGARGTTKKRSGRRVRSIRDGKREQDVEAEIRCAADIDARWEEDSLASGDRFNHSGKTPHVIDERSYWAAIATQARCLAP